MLEVHEEDIQVFIKQENLNIIFKFKFFLIIQDIKLTLVF